MSDQLANEWRTDEAYMREALRQAAAAASEGEVPIGAVIAHEGTIIARAHNLRETLRDPTAHAEMIAITQASEALDRWRLTGTTIYVTIEPCAMCAGAAVLARIRRIVYGAADPKAGACGSVFNVIHEPALNHRVELTSGILANECGGIMSEFFTRKRERQ